MRTLLARFGLLTLAAVAASSGAPGCAAERDPINRVQANALPKSFFVGEKIADPGDDPEFRLKSFTVDSSRQQSTYSVGEFSGVERIRWEITEGMLLARRSYQELEGADLRGVPKEQWIQRQGDKAFVKDPNGTVIAAFRIESHFDVRRSYNSLTGEEANVVEENASDRPWSEREFIRVDWSKNLATSTRDSARLFGSAKVTPVEYAITDPKAEDAPHVELEGGYFDVTNKFTLEPEEVRMPWGTIPHCVLESFVTGSGASDCSPQEATMRLSFSRIEPSKEDFESFEDDFAWNDVVGNWSAASDGRDRSLGTARQAWDPAYGATDAQTKRLKAVHEIWTKSHQEATCGSNADADRNGTADACENAATGWAGHTGSQCDLLANRCTIPVRDREVKTIAYHLNREAPDALQDEVDPSGNVARRGTLEDLTHSWNQLLSVSVATRREVECRRTGDGTRESCHAEFFESDRSPAKKTMVSFGGWLVDTVKPQEVDHGKAVLTACHNPVRDYDPEVCGKPGETARFGDIRKNFLVYWPYESNAHYGGVGANPPDPLTGQTFGATATIMGRSATYAAGMQRDIVQLAMGDLSMEDVVSGVPSQRFAAILRDGQAAPRAKTEEELAAAATRTDPARLRAETGMTALPADGARAALAETVLKSKTMRDSTAYATSVAELDALASRLRSTPFEAQVADGRWMTSVLGASPSAPTTSEMLDLASPLRGLDPARVDALHKWYGQSLADRGACFHDATLAGAGSVYQASLGGFFKAKYKDLDPKTRGERIYDDLWKEAVKGIGLHELGHSLGLRHNFASSWDATNFQPQYWQLRTSEGKAKQACKGPRAGDDDACMGPRYLDPATADEQGLAGESRPGIDYFGTTSTMEYSIERFGETAGLGTYDLHAMKSLYGRVLEAYDDAVVPRASQADLATKTFTQLQEKDIVRNGSKFFAHYTQTARLANVFDPERDCRPATPEEKATAAWRLVHGKVCAPPPKDHASWDDFKTDEIPGTGVSGVKWHATPKGSAERVRWPYRYGEQYGAGGYMHTTMGDAGADVYELVQNLEKRFDLGYPWTYFRRGRANWVSLFLPQATASQFFSRLRSYHWQIATELGRSKAADLADDDTGRPYAMAQGEAFRVLSKALLMPEPGTYAQSAERTPPGSARAVFDLTSGAGGPAGSLGAFSLDVADARYIGDDFQNELGGSWNYQQYLHHAGYEVEKTLALMQLVDPRPTLSTVARENYLDGRAPKISFRTDMPDAVDRLLGGVLAEDWEAVAPSVMPASATPAKGSGILPLDLTLPTAKRDPAALIVFPNIGYKQQLATAMHAALLSRVGGDMMLVNKLRVWLDGDRAPELPTSRQVRLTDPRTGYTYVASRFGTDVIDGKTVDRGIGSRMLQHANALLTAAYDVKKDAGGKPVLDETGRAEVAMGADGQPKVLSAEAEATFRRYVGLVDAMRQLQIVLGSGPLGGEDQ